MNTEHLYEEALKQRDKDIAKLLDIIVKYDKVIELYESIDLTPKFIIPTPSLN